MVASLPFSILQATCTSARRKAVQDFTSYKYTFMHVVFPMLIHRDRWNVIKLYNGWQQNEATESKS